MLVNVMIINAQIASADEFYNHAKNCEALLSYALTNLCLDRTKDGFRIRVDFADSDTGNSIFYFSNPIHSMLEGISQLGNYYARILDLKFPIPLDVVRIYCYDETK